VCFKYRNYFGSIDDGWRAAFPIHQDIISNIPLESMKSASQGLKSQSCSLPMTFTNYCRGNVSFNYIFFLDWICLFAFWRKGLPLEGSGDEVMKQLLHLIMKTAPIGLLFRLSSWYFGPQLFGAYATIGSLLWSLCFLLCGIFLAMHLFWEDKWVEGFLDNNITPALTALGTCSSIHYSS
jgi:hypothetical protein